MVAIDEAHLIAPHIAASARDAETRRLGVATLTDLCGRGRKRGITTTTTTTVATQRLAKLAASVVSELHNVLLGLNIFDRDVARAGDLLGFGSEKAAALRNLAAGEFYALGPALCPRPILVRIAPTITRHVGATPELVGSADVTPEQARELLNLDRLRELATPGGTQILPQRGVRALDCFLLDQHAPIAARIIAALRAISPNATTAAELEKHLGAELAAVHGRSAFSSVGPSVASPPSPRGSGSRTPTYHRTGAPMSSSAYWRWRRRGTATARSRSFSPRKDFRRAHTSRSARFSGSWDMRAAGGVATTARCRHRKLATSLGRKKGGVFNKAFALGLVHGYIRPFREDEKAAIRIAHDARVSLTDLSAALGRDPAVVSKHAIRHLGLSFRARANKAPRGKRCLRPKLMLTDILRLGDKRQEAVSPAPIDRPASPAAHAARHLVAGPNIPPMNAAILHGMLAAGLLVPCAVGSDVLILGQRPDA